MAATRKPHFEVDKKGLAQLLARRGKAFVVTELLSNCWDEASTRVDVAFEWLGDGKVRITVEDDNPEGFADLADAYTLFAPSRKKVNPQQRGRFNLGEKLVVAVCDTVIIETTKGTVMWDSKGRVNLAKKRPAGSLFTGVMKMKRGEYDEVLATIGTVIPPAGIVTTINFNEIAVRQPVTTFEESLRTEIADADGNLKPTVRKTAVELHEPLPGEEPTLYELGVPVVSTGDRYHVNVMQKVPLNTDRDGVTPAFLRDVRTAVLNHGHAFMSGEDMHASWVVDALQDEHVDSEAVGAAVKGRFGDRAVSYDPSDPEANKRAMSEGFTVIPGGALPKAAWKNVKANLTVLPAGQVTPSPNPNAGEEEIKMMAPEHYPEAVEQVVAFTREFAKRLVGHSIRVRVGNAPKWPFHATYGEGQLTFNYGRLGHKWFDGPLSPIVDLVIHELGHEFESDHLSDRYLHALTKLAGKAVQLALDEPDLFDFRSAKVVSLP